MLALGLA